MSHIFLIVFILLSFYRNSEAVLPPEVLSPICEVKAKVLSTSKNKIKITVLTSKYVNDHYYEGKNNCSEQFPPDLQITVYEPDSIMDLIGKDRATIAVPIQKQKDMVTEEIFYKTSDFSGYPNNHRIISENSIENKDGFLRTIITKLMVFFSKILQ